MQYPITGVVRTLCLAGALVVFSMIAPGRSAEAAFPGANGQIAFERFGDVYLADPDGTDARRIEFSGSQTNPVISPDGTKIAYEYGRGIWVMNADGVKQRRVSSGTNSTTFADADPAWAPEGKMIVFSRYQAGDSDLWGANVDGTGQKNLTNTPGYDELDPAWSPAGDEIAYTRVGCDQEGGISCVFKMNADGTGQTNLTSEDRLPGCLSQPGYHHRGASSDPSWSADGAKIAFRGTVTCPHSGGSDIWVMGPDGGGKFNVTNDDGTSDGRPAYAPDGSRIAFNSSRPSGSATAVYLIGVGGGTPGRLAASTGFDNDPDWGPAPPSPPPVVTNTNDSGPGSLRRAVAEANAAPGADTVAFDIPGTGTKVIAPASPLPGITDPLTLDGTTQSGYAGKPVVVLNGANAGAGAFGLDVTAGDSTIRGLAINGFDGGAIRFSRGGGNAVEGCHLGTDASGTRARGNGVGVVISGSGSNRIGGNGPSQGNVISGNGGYGVNVEGDLGQNAIVGNLIGTDASGTAGLGNAYSGVRLGVGVRGTGIGNNTISDNGTGIELFGYEANPLRNNTISNNRIGTDVDGAKDLGNSGYGVKVAGARFTDVLSNSVAFNGGAGVAVLIGEGTRISQNSLYANGREDSTFGLGIDLGGDGVTPNDPEDSDTGPNGLQNHPVLTSVETVGDSTEIRGTLRSAPNTAFGIEFFSSPAADPSGHGEGQVPLPSPINVTTDGSGDASFAYTSGGPVPGGHVVSATATPNDQVSGTLSTSEFSEAIVVPDVTPPDTGISSGPEGFAKRSSATFSFRSSEPGSRFECALDDGAFARCASPHALSGLTDGRHTLRVRAVDVSGNADPTPAARSWRVDTAGPSGSVKIDGGAARTGTRKVGLTLKASDPAPASGVAWMRLSNDGRSWSSWQRYTSSRNWTLTAGAGKKSVFVQYRDRAGNPSAVARDTISYNP